MFFHKMLQLKKENEFSIVNCSKEAARCQSSCLIPAFNSALQPWLKEQGRDTSPAQPAGCRGGSSGTSEGHTGSAPGQGGSGDCKARSCKSQAQGYIHSHSCANQWPLLNNWRTKLGRVNVLWVNQTLQQGIYQNIYLYIYTALSIYLNRYQNTNPCYTALRSRDPFLVQ